MSVARIIGKDPLPGDCPPDGELWRGFTVSGYPSARAAKQAYVEYNYRSPSGELFITTARTLAEARQKRDRWMGASRPVPTEGVTP